MTIAATPTGLPDIDDVAWRALGEGLWVARRDDRHIGAVQHGRRWLASDADGDPIGVFPSFREAQVAVQDPATHRAPIRRSSSVVPAFTVGALAAAVLSAAGWLITGLPA